MFIVNVTLFTIGLMLKVGWVYFSNSGNFTVAQKGRFLGRTAAASVIAFCTSLYILANAISESSPDSTAPALATWISFPIIFCAIIAFLYKEFLVPSVTEGLVLLHSLTATYIFFTTFTDYPLPTFVSVLMLIFLPVSTIMAFLVCLLRQNLKPLEEVGMMVLFFISSVYIMSVGAVILLYSNTSLLSYILAGFYSLHLMSYIIYMLYLIPIRYSNRQSAGKRKRQIIDHVSFLEKKYIDINMTPLRTLFIFLLVGSLLLFDSYVSDPLSPVLIVLIIGTVLTHPHTFSRLEDK